MFGRTKERTEAQIDRELDRARETYEKRARAYSKLAGQRFPKPYPEALEARHAEMVAAERHVKVLEDEMERTRAA